MTKFIDLSIVIPTLNEEFFIGFLLDSIAHQTIQPKEIVVVDAYSKDKTINQVKSRNKKLPQLKFFQIPKFTISRQRNFGSKQTTAGHLLFLDADTQLRGEDTLKEYLEQIKKKGCDLAIATNKSATGYWKDRVFFKVMDLTFKISKPIWPMAVGINMYFKREVFDRIGGFDEDIAVGEDFEIVHRLVKNKGKFSIISNPKIYTSPRRFEKEGRIRFAFKTTRAFFRIVRKGFRDNPMEYEFGRFTKDFQSKKPYG